MSPPSIACSRPTRGLGSERLEARIVTVAEPLVSVVIPTHNRGARLTGAVASALGQTLPPLEILVVDDASPDPSAERAACGIDPRVRYLCLEQKSNAASARNHGAAMARGDWLAFLDSDDAWYPDHLERTFATLAACPGALGAWGGCRLVRAGRLVRIATPRKLRRGERALDYLMAGGAARTSTFVFANSAFQSIRFDDRLTKHQDWDLFVRFIERFPMVAQPVPTVVADVGGGDRMSARHDAAGSERFYSRYRTAFSPWAHARFCLAVAERALASEGRRASFRLYYRRVPWRLVGAGSTRLALRILLGKLRLALPGMAYCSRHIRDIVLFNRRLA